MMVRTSCFCDNIVSLTDGRENDSAHLQDLHEPRNIQLGVQGEVVDVCNQSSDFFLEQYKLVFEGVNRVQIFGVHLVFGVVVVRAGVLRDAMPPLLDFRICRVPLVSVLLTALPFGIGVLNVLFGN